MALIGPARGRDKGELAGGRFSGAAQGWRSERWTTYYRAAAGAGGKLFKTERLTKVIGLVGVTRASTFPCNEDQGEAAEWLQPLVVMFLMVVIRCRY